MTPRLTHLGPQMKLKAYVSAVALLSAIAGGILCLSSDVASPTSRVASSGARNSKLEIGKPKLAGLKSLQGMPPAQARLVKNYGKLPLRFEANAGQTDTRVKFVSRGRGYTMFLTGNEAVLSLRGESQERNGKGQGAKAEGPTLAPLPSLFAPPGSLLSISETDKPIFGARHSSLVSTVRSLNLSFVLTHFGS